MSLTFSIVIPSHKRADLLRLCLDSLQDHAPPGTQVIVVDDGSPGAIVSSTAEDFPFVRVVRHEKSQGFCVAANRGIAAATGDVVEMLNDDTEVTAGWAEAALRWFADPKIGAVAPLVLQNEPARRELGLPPRIDTAGDEYDPGGYAIKRGHNEPFHPGGPYSLPRPVWGVSAAAGFYRRQALVEAGGFPESFGAYFDDVDLSFRIRNRGYQICYEPTAVVWHRVSASYGRRPSRRVIEMQSRNEELVFWRNTRGQQLWLHLPRHLGVLAAKSLRRAQEQTLFAWSLGRFRAWGELVSRSCARIA
ncbi:glycosyltransferase family 2 protein [Limnoglobus roseus]|uniref:GT2 family glycosyltransferase n=1 Tax=Limnoglobus roseus TaxID=2598579 RepID=A0A5C1AJG6_9BACT|nr:glycosyltransferase family 2 protein [Limnoglobus roseus]QEL18146.1 GT2 family glycosyltransferase [Limnoglobus roseus]